MLALDQLVAVALSRSTSSLTSTTARILRARPWLVPALGLLVGAAGASAWWLFRVVATDASALEAFTVRPGLRAVHVSFRTARPARARVELWPASTSGVAPEDGPQVEHGFDVPGLSATTDYRLTLFVDGVARMRTTFRTQALLIEHLKKEVSLSRLKLSWTTTLPARCTLRYAASGQAPQERACDEAAATAHAVELTGLAADRDYQLEIDSETETRETSHMAFRVKLFTAAAAEAVDEIDRAGIPKRILDVLWEYRHRKPDRERLQAVLREQLDPVRQPLKAVRAISREFFASRDVPVDSKLRLYATLKLVEHVDRMAKIRNLPMVELLAPFDWGPYAELTASFGDPKLPLPEPRAPLLPGQKPPAYLTDPSLLPGVLVDQELQTMTAPTPITELRERTQEQEAIEVFGRGERDGASEHVYRFALPDASKVQAAELWMMISAGSPLQFFELAVNGHPPLILRAPPAESKNWQWYRAGVGVDPALLASGENLVKLHLKPIPEVLDGHRMFVWFLELRTKVKS